MPRFEPFPALRYSLDAVGSLTDVVCPPYDVIAEPERLALLSKSAYNVVRLELPRSEGQADPYRQAAILLDAWREQGILRRDPKPAIYGYRMSYTSASGKVEQTSGVIGALGLERPGQGVLPHEETTPKAKTDRLELLRATKANLSPIWGLTPAGGLSELLSKPVSIAGRAEDPDGVLHELWIIDSPAEMRDITALVTSAPVLIADGHHRYETALTYYESQTANGAKASSASAYVMALIVELSDDQLSVRPIHRLVSGLPDGGVTTAAFEEGFELTPIEIPAGPNGQGDRITRQLEENQAMAIVTAGGAWLATARSETRANAAHDLDSSRLDSALSRIPTSRLSYEHDLSAALAAVRSGQAQAAVLVRPPSVRQIAAIAEGGVRMPPKTTFFWPKPRTGMVIRELVGSEPALAGATGSSSSGE